MRPRDRLAELKNIAEETNVYNETVELYIKEPNDGVPKEIINIFEEVGKIRGWIDDINGKNQLICRLHSDPTYHTNKHLQDQLDSTITTTNAIGLKVCGALRQFEELIKSLEVSDVRARIARLQYATTRTLYGDALGRYHGLLQEIKKTQDELIVKELKLTNIAISDEECESLLENNNIQLFVDNVLTRTHEAKMVLREVEARHAQLLKIEASIREVHELFLQMGHLIASQQELIDTVEYYATQTTELVQCGGRELLKGTVSRTKAKKKKISLIICLVVGFLILLIILIMT